VISLAERINDALPQTQCTRCGFPDCKAYAQAIAQDNAPINQCPPGGLEGVAVLSKITGRPELPLNPDNGTEGPMTVAVIDEAWCIGCTLCLKVCPTDAILGSNKVMHTVIEAACTGCDLCLPVCPVDCIEMVPISDERTGWSAWSPALAQQARQRYEARQLRLIEEDKQHASRQQSKAEMKLADLATPTRFNAEPTTEEAMSAVDAGKEMVRKRAIIEAALAKAKARQKS
jgi:electron transport complex protein RnfB